MNQNGSESGEQLHREDRELRIKSSHDRKLEVNCGVWEGHAGDLAGSQPARSFPSEGGNTTLSCERRQSSDLCTRAHCTDDELDVDM